jgi:hypothetical protein
MIDGEAKLVLDALKKLTQVDGVYKVIEAEEIIELLPVPLTKLQLSSAIRDLRDREYIKVKYFTPDEYCLSTTRIIEDVVEHTEEVTAVATVAPVAPQVAQKPVSAKKAFALAFVGAFLGGGIVMAIAIILLKFIF